MVGDERKGQLIRATNLYGYRYGWTNPWGLVVETGWWVGRERFVYVVKYDDGVVDVWPQVDDSDPYEFCLPEELASGKVSASGTDVPPLIDKE